MDEAFIVPMSLAQERLWFIERLSPTHGLFHLSTITRLRRAVRPELVERALNEIIRRHEALRTTFDIVDDVPSQIVAPELELTVPVTDVSDLPEPDRERAALAAADEEATRPFDLRTGPLLRLRLIRLSDREHLLAFTIHHIVSDGWSMGQFWHELGVISQALAEGRPSPLPELDTQYADFAVWQRAWLTGSVREEQLSYWRQKLAKLPPVLELPTDRPRPPLQSFRGSSYRTIVPAPLLTGVERLARAEGATSFMVFLAALQTLLHRYTGSEDIVIGTYTAGRDQPQTEHLIGFFLNTLVLRTDLSGEPTFRDLLARARDTALDAYAHQDLPFATLVQDLHPDRDPSRNPLFQVMFQMINVPTLERLTADQQAAAVQPLRTHAAFDLSLALQPRADDQLVLEVEYSTDLFERGTVERLVSHLLTLLASALETPDRRLADLAIMTTAEREQLIQLGTGEARPQPAGPDLCDLLAEQVARQPHAVAYRTADGEIRYSELDRASSRLAARLASCGVRAQSRVVVLLPRRGAHLVALWATLKCHAVYVPVTEDSPPARTARILAQVQPVAVVTRSALLAGLDLDPQMRVVDVDSPEPAPSPPAGAPEHQPSALDDLAYIIFTSGSTGTPKGVCVPHRQVLNRLRWMGRTYPFLAGEVACHKTSLSFVDSLWEMLGPLLAGIPTTVLTDEVVRDPERFVAALAESAVTRIWLVPALLRTVLDTPGDLAERLPRLRFWVSSGEGLPAELLERFERRLPGATLYNLYGTSEVWDATWWDPATDGSRGWRTPIGRPIDNVTVRVLDRNRALVPIGVQGELYVGGAGLARGYLADPQLTADRFVADPLQPGSTLYRSLDLALWRPSGQLEFVARADALLKIRGYRIDPTEVEDALMSLPEVGGAAVVAREDGSAGPRLVAYLVPRGPAELDITDVRRALADLLPQYMLPASVVWLPAFPVTPSGKIDRTRLPRQSDTARSRRRHLQAPRDDAERTITAVWEDVLQTQVGTQDNFFDLGGHSLLLVKVHDRLRSLLGVELSITDLFRYPTVASLAAHCARHAPPPPTTDQVPSPDALVLPMTPTAVGAAR